MSQCAEIMYVHMYRSTCSYHNEMSIYSINNYTRGRMYMWHAVVRNDYSLEELVCFSDNVSNSSGQSIQTEQEVAAVEAKKPPEPGRP